MSNMDSNFYDDDFSFFRETGDDVPSGGAAISSAKTPAKRMRKKQKNEKGRKRSTRACDMCHRRKVRCNVVVEGGPCLNCKLDGIMCFIPREEQRKSPKRATASTQTQTHPDDLPPSMNTSVPREIVPETCELRRVLSTSNEESGGPSYDIFETFPPHLEAADLAYLHSHDALNIPTERFQITLLGAFVEFVYPRMPIIDLEEFFSIVKNRKGGVSRGRGGSNELAFFSSKKLSLLLFQAVLFAGVEFVSTKILREEGFESREVAREALFNRVRLLYDFDTCTQRLSVIQALLLMTVCSRSTGRSVGFKDAAHWLDQAISFAFSLGLNRHFDLDRSTHRQKSLNRRIWWALFIQDRTMCLNSSSGIRRTTRIRREDCKISMATLDDFELDELEDAQNEAETFKIRANALFFVEKAVLCWSLNPSELDEFAVVAPKALQPHYSRSSTNSTRYGGVGGTSTGISSPFECQISTPSANSHITPNPMEMSSMGKDLEGLRAILATDGRVELEGATLDDGAREFSDYMEYIGEAISGQDKSPMDMVSGVDLQGALQNPSSAVF